MNFIDSHRAEIKKLKKEIEFKEKQADKFRHLLIYLCVILFVLACLPFYISIPLFAIFVIFCVRLWKKYVSLHLKDKRELKEKLEQELYDYWHKDDKYYYGISSISYNDTPNTSTSTSSYEPEPSPSLTEWLGGYLIADKIFDSLFGKKK